MQHTKIIEISQLKDSIDNAASFLLESRSPQGWWQDFYVGRNPSDEWITAYVGVALAAISNHQVQQAASNAWKLLITRHRSTGGWGFNPLIPEDADSTGWVLQLAKAVGVNNSELPYQQAISFIEQHYQPDGGISTYASDVAIKVYLQESVRLFGKKIQQGKTQNIVNEELERQFKIFAIKHRQPQSILANNISDQELQDCLNTPSQESFVGWCQSHICVSAAIACLDEFYSTLQEYLIKTQSPDGYWPSYWWVDPEYATLLAAEALQVENSEANQLCIDKAIKWGMKRLSYRGFVANEKYPEGSPFATALCLRLLLQDKNSEDVENARNAIIKWLLEKQDIEGSWVSSALLRIPHTYDVNPNQTTEWLYNGFFNGSIIEDRHSIFTTATAMYSLQKVFESLAS